MIGMRADTAAKKFLSRAIVLHPFYISRPQLWSPQLWEIDARIALSLDRKFCYVRVPKAANTAVASTLFYHETGHVPTKRLEAKRAFRRPTSIARFTPGSLEDFFCFTFVRNPYHRILSAYLSKLVARGSKAPYREIGAAIRERRGGELSFRTFCAYLADGGLYGNPHWYPQCRFIDAVGVERLQLVGRVENMKQDIARVVERIFGRADDKTYATEEVKTGASGKAADHYDATTRGIVRELYREDFERLGYDPDALA